MIENQTDEFQSFNKVPLEGNIRVWKETGIHKEPAKTSYQWQVKLNGHNIVFAEPDDFGTIIACVNCKRGVDLDELTPRLKKYVLGYFFQHSCH